VETHESIKDRMESYGHHRM